MLERHIEPFGVVPQQIAAKDNLAKAQIKAVAFHKKGGLSIEERVKSQWVYRTRR